MKKREESSRCGRERESVRARARCVTSLCSLSVFVYSPSARNCSVITALSLSPSLSLTHSLSPYVYPPLYLACISLFPSYALSVNNIMLGELPAFTSQLGPYMGLAGLAITNAGGWRERERGGGRDGLRGEVGLSERQRGSVQ